MPLTPAQHSPDELRAMGKQRILLVDDEPDILEFIEYNLVKEDRVMLFIRYQIIRNF